MTDEKLLQTLAQLISLLRACQGQLAEDAAAWLQEQRDRLLGTTDPSVWHATKTELGSHLAGMGSLDDLELEPKPGAKMGWREVRQRQSILIEELDQLLSRNSP